MSDLTEVREALEGFQKLLQSLRFPDQQAVRAIAALSRTEDQAALPREALTRIAALRAAQEGGGG